VVRKKRERRAARGRTTRRSPPRFPWRTGSPGRPRRRSTTGTGRPCQRRPRDRQASVPSRSVFRPDDGQPRPRSVRHDGRTVGGSLRESSKRRSGGPEARRSGVRSLVVVRARFDPRPVHRTATEREERSGHRKRARMGGNARGAGVARPRCALLIEAWDVDLMKAPIAGNTSVYAKSPSMAPGLSSEAEREQRQRTEERRRANRRARQQARADEGWTPRHGDGHELENTLEAAQRDGRPVITREGGRTTRSVRTVGATSDGDVTGRAPERGRTPSGA